MAVAVRSRARPRAQPPRPCPLSPPPWRRNTSRFVRGPAPSALFPSPTAHARPGPMAGRGVHIKTIRATVVLKISLASGKPRRPSGLWEGGILTHFFPKASALCLSAANTPESFHYQKNNPCRFFRTREQSRPKAPFGTLAARRFFFNTSICNTFICWSGSCFFGTRQWNTRRFTGQQGGGIVANSKPP